MSRIIATNSCHSQQPIRADEGINLQPMVAYTKLDFAARLNDACGKANPPIPEGRGRRSELRRRVISVGLTVSGESVRKWLSGESIPSMDNIRFIAIALSVEADWLLTGRKAKSETAKKAGGHQTANEPAPVLYGNFNPTISQVIEIMGRLENDEQQQILGFAKVLDYDAHKASQNSTPRASQ